MSNLDILDYRLRVTGKLRLETALRVGSGFTDELSGADMAVIKDSSRRPYIPGSSFKGALRVHVERLVRALEPGAEPGNGRGACNPVNRDEWCVTSEEMAELRRSAENLDAEVYENSCRVCRVFGSPWLASRIWIKDLLLSEPEIWFDRQYQVRHGVGIDRDSETAAYNVLYDFETVPAGTQFDWEVVIDNPDRDQGEDGMVIWGLREFASERIPLGGGRSRGLGRVALYFDDYAEEVDRKDRQALIDYLINNQGRPVSSEDLLARVAKFASKLAG